MAEARTGAVQRGQAWAGVLVFVLVLAAVGGGVVLWLHGPFNTVHPAARTTRTAPPATVVPTGADLDQIRACVRELVDVAGKADLSYPERSALLSACNGV